MTEDSPNGQERLDSLEDRIEKLYDLLEEIMQRLLNLEDEED